VANDPRSAPALERISTGIPELDEMLMGGLLPHRPYLVVGPPGSGKTTLALQFLIEGIRRGEEVLYVTLEEPPNEVRRDHQAMGTELDQIYVFDAVPDVMRYERIPFKDISSVRAAVRFSQVPATIRQTPEFESVDVTMTALQPTIRQEVRRRHYKRLVIDSLTALQFFCMPGVDITQGAQTFLRFLADLGTTTLLTLEAPSAEEESEEHLLARGELRLFRWEAEGKSQYAIGVEKFRGSSHDIFLHPYRMSPHGLDINLSVTIPSGGVALPAAQPETPEVLGVPPEEVAYEIRRSVLNLDQDIRDLIDVGLDVKPMHEGVRSVLTALADHRFDEALLRLRETRALADQMISAYHAAEAAQKVTPSIVVTEVSPPVPPPPPPPPPPLVEAMPAPEEILPTITPPDATPETLSPGQPPLAAAAAPTDALPPPPPQEPPAPPPPSLSIPPPPPPPPPPPTLEAVAELTAAPTIPAIVESTARPPTPQPPVVISVDRLVTAAPPTPVPPPTPLAETPAIIEPKPPAVMSVVSQPPPSPAPLPVAPEPVSPATTAPTAPPQAVHRFFRRAPKPSPPVIHPTAHVKKIPSTTPAPAPPRTPSNTSPAVSPDLPALASLPGTASPRSPPAEPMPPLRPPPAPAPASKSIPPGAAAKAPTLPPAQVSPGVGAPPLVTTAGVAPPAPIPPGVTAEQPVRAIVESLPLPPPAPKPPKVRRRSSAAPPRKAPVKPVAVVLARIPRSPDANMVVTPPPQPNPPMVAARAPPRHAPRRKRKAPPVTGADPGPMLSDREVPAPPVPSSAGPSEETAAGKPNPPSEG
jgi:KaiC/GvpD/RAD55 family RecA-like ATPase